LQVYHYDSANLTLIRNVKAPIANGNTLEAGIPVRAEPFLDRSPVDGQLFDCAGGWVASEDPSIGFLAEIDSPFGIFRQSFTIIKAMLSPRETRKFAQRKEMRSGYQGGLLPVRRKINPIDTPSFVVDGKELAGAGKQ
jgi:hypothetical protein